MLLLVLQALQQVVAFSSFVHVITENYSPVPYRTTATSGRFQIQMFKSISYSELASNEAASFSQKLQAMYSYKS